VTKKLAVVCVVLLIGLMPVPGFTLAPESRVGSEESAQASVAKGTGWDDKVAASIAGLGITGDATMGQALTSITNAKAQLGMKLFFTKGLGGDKDAACVTCHHPKLGGGDNLSLPIGVTAEIPDLLGPGRRHLSAGVDFDGGPTVPRNAPTTFNLSLWEKVLFHDGRVEAITGGISTPDSGHGNIDPAAGANLAEAQARFPVTSPEEMRGFVYEAGNSTAALRTALEIRLQTTGAGINALNSNDWLAEFRTGFGSTADAATLITFSKIAEAIGEYENSQVFVSHLFKEYIDGNKAAISKDAKKGAVLFFNSVEEGGANCASCHRGDFYTDEAFHVVAMPQIGRGKGDGTGSDDFGRFRLTGQPEDKYAFRTPTLLNVEKTGPWGHAGGYTSLNAVINHHLNPQSAIDNYDFSQLESSVQVGDMKANTQHAIDTLEVNRSAGLISPILENVSLTEKQVNQLVAFLKTLTDQCLNDDACISAWIPASSDTDPDSLRVNAVNENGLAL
jgi:cytochrome c peroxidase